METLKWIKGMYHLDVALAGFLASLLMLGGLMIDNKNIILWLLLIGNIVFASLNWFMSWKKDEFNRRTYRKL